METETTEYKLKRTPTDDEMFEAVTSGLDPILEAFKDELASKGDRTLQIQITREGGNYKINYGIGDVSPRLDDNVTEPPSPQQCYKTGKPCPYDCSGLCRDAE